MAAHREQDRTNSELTALIEERRWMDLRERLAHLPAAEIVDLLREAPDRVTVVIFHVLRRDQQAEVFARLEAADKDALLRAFTDEEARQLLASLPPDDRTQLLEEVPGVVTQRLLNLLSPDDLREARQLLGYPEESVGRLMTPDYVAVRPEWTVEAALAHIRQRGRHSETIDIVYVVDPGWHLLDDLELRRLILSEGHTTIRELMDGTFVSVSAAADREEAVRLILRHGIAVLPVVDSAGVLLGIVTVDDVFDVAEEEVTEDFHRVGSVEPLQMSLKEATIGLLYRRRIGWLLALVLMNVFSGAGIAFFEDTIAASVALVFFLPLLIDSSGNAGSQSATLVIRALATGDASARDWLALLRRELPVAAAMGLTMAGAVTLVALMRAPDIAVAVAITMVAVVMTGSLIGISLPFLFNRLGWDSATASAPLITSISDITGVLIYFSVASWYLAPG
jgi:magnesium transporter